MKKIFGVIALASLTLGAFADAEFAVNYRTQMAGFSRVLSGDKTDTLGKEKHTSYLFAQDKGYGGASDTISATVAGDLCGATIRIDPFPGKSGKEKLTIHQYSGYVNIGKFTLNAGAWKDGQYVGDWQLKQDADACNLGGETFAAYKLGNMFKNKDKKSYGLTSSYAIDDIANFGGTSNSTTAYVKWGGAVGPKKTFVELYASAIGITDVIGEEIKTWDDDGTVYSGFAFKADVTTKTMRTQFIAKLPTVSNRAFGLYFMPQGTGALTTVVGGTLGFDGANLTDANVDLRMRYAGKGYSVTFFNNISHITNSSVECSLGKTVGAYAQVSAEPGKGISAATPLVSSAAGNGQKYNTVMWNMLALRYKLSNKVFFTAEAGDMVYFNNMLNDDAAWAGIDAFVCPGIQIFAGGKTSVSMGVRFGATGIGAQTLDAHGDRESAYENSEMTTSVLVPVVMRIRF